MAASSVIYEGPMAPVSRPISALSPSERWVAFLRGYGPVNRAYGMFAETVPTHARKYGIEPLEFDHPELETLKKALDPASCTLTNVILTGTAGDGKTTLCNQLWTMFGGANHRSTGKNRDSYLALDVDTPRGTRKIHFFFEFTGWSSDKGQSWSPDRLELMNRFARSVHAVDPDEFFIIAVNDGRLIQTWDTLPKDSEAASLADDFEELLASDKRGLEGLSLLFLNLSRMSTRALLEQALDCLLNRAEWNFLQGEANDLAFGETSPLIRNFRLLQEPAVRERLLSLAELLDANGLHVPIREILLLLVNGLLGWPDASEQVADSDDLRNIVREGRSHEAALYANIFGANLPDRRREGSAVFRYLTAFRIGHETTNLLDGLLIYGSQDPGLEADYNAYLANDPYYGANPKFEALRQAYLEAEDERNDGAARFLEALVNERRRLFFRLPEVDGRLNPWRLSIFQSAGSYRCHLLAPLRAGRSADPAILKLLVCGLNRIWTGMLVGELDRLYLSTGLDLSSARISDIYLYEIPLRRSPHGEEVTVFLRKGDMAPTLRVTLGADGYGAEFKLHLMRFEFLVRVAQGALPSSFSKECNEDVMAFKAQVLSTYYNLVGEISGNLSRLIEGPRGSLTSHQLGVSL